MVLLAIIIASAPFDAIYKPNTNVSIKLIPTLLLILIPNTKFAKSALKDLSIKL